MHHLALGILHRPLTPPPAKAWQCRDSILGGCNDRLLFELSGCAVAFLWYQGGGGRHNNGRLKK